LHESAEILLAELEANSEVGLREERQKNLK